MPFKNPHPLYSVWQGMKRRCDNPNFRQFPDYGGRGIFVCDRWINSFQNFLDDMGDRPAGHSIERTDNDGPYSPENCRWASKRDQQRNQSRTRMVVIEGVAYKAVDLADRSGWKTDTIVERAKLGLTLAEVLAPRRIKNGAWKAAVAARLASQRTRTHCKNGHGWSAENTRITPQGWRNCRACAREKAQRRRDAELA